MDFSETERLLIDLTPLILLTLVAHFVLWWVLREIEPKTDTKTEREKP